MHFGKIIAATLRGIYLSIWWGLRFFLNIFSSVLAWLILGLAWLVHEIFQDVGSFFYNMFATIGDVSVGRLPVNDLADWIGRDIMALDVAWECIAIAISVWVAARTARLSIAFIRTIVDLL